MKQKTERNIKKIVLLSFLGLLAVAAVSGTLFLAYYSVEKGTLLVRTNGDPVQTVEEYYDAVLAGEYETAYGYLRDYESLGLEMVPDSAYEEKLFAALKESYAYELTGEMEIQDLTAVQEVRFTYLDIGALLDDAESRMESILNELIQSQPKKDSFDEENNYKPEVLEKAYQEAFAQAFKNESRYRQTDEYEVQLEYIDGIWYIVTSSDMMKGFSGGVL